ncbi:MAG TPA: hypothetical protein VK894_07380 [Jiangellales bacterium]|nr:hypothetical protein [Jiangellales bacterium]
MRVYLPATLPSLAAAHAAGSLPGPGHTGHAVTPALREAYAEGDLEELEYAALRAAARDSLRLLAADPEAPPRRVVLAVEVADAVADARLGRSGVRVDGEVPLARLAAVHVDDVDAVPTVAAAVEALPAADAGDDDAAFAVDEADGFELLWFAAQEVPDLVR